MTSYLMKSTQVMIAFQIEGDREQELVSLITMLTQVISFLFSAWQRVSRFYSEWVTLISDLRAALSFTGKVTLIGLNSLAFGLGVRL